jgi:nickel superoxide dismutase
MSLLKEVFNFLEFFIPAKKVYAHCDIPCGIYDPHLAQVSAHTVIRMNMLISQLKPLSTGSKAEEINDYNHKLIRYTDIKEKHSELCKQELRILWGDYFKPEHVQKFPELHELFWKSMKDASKAKQEINMRAAEELLNTVNKIAEIFWKTKGIETNRVKAPYPTEHDIVLPKLD